VLITWQKTIEQSSPQIAGEDAEIWRGYIKRDIQNWEKKILEPSNPKSWWKVYRKLKKEDEEARKESEAALLAALQGVKEEKARHTLTIVDRVSDPTKRKRPQPALKRSYAPSSGSGSRTKLTAQGWMEKAKREVQEEKRQRVSALATPTHMLANRASTVRQAPKGMVEEHKRPPLPREAADPNAPKPTRIFAPRKSSISKSSSAAATQDPVLAAREQRLKALTASGTRPLPVVAEEERASLPAGATFNVPRLKKVASPSPKLPEKRKRGPDVFMTAKRRA